MFWFGIIGLSGFSEFSPRSVPLGTLRELSRASRETKKKSEDRSPAPAQRKAPNQPQRPAAQAPKSNGKSPEEKALDELLLAHCVKEKKGEKNGQAFFNAMYGKKTLEQKREAAKTLGLTVAGPVTPAAPAAPIPQPVTPPQADVVEGELIEEATAELSPARLDIENLSDRLHALGCPSEHINAKIAKIAGGVYATDEIKEEDLPKVRLMLSRYVEMGASAAAEIAKEFKPKEGK